MKCIHCGKPEGLHSPKDKLCVFGYDYSQNLYFTPPMNTPSPLEGYRIQLRELRAEMKRMAVRKISPFNGGLTPDEYRMNSERFRLETEIMKLSKRL